MNKNIIIIMAGGLGKRMNSDLPKVLHKIHNKPMLVRVIEQSILLNPLEILVVVGKYKDIIQKTIGEYINKNTLKNSNIKFILQPEPLGTGNAIQCCQNELEKYPNTNVIILSGDVPLLKSSTINDMLYNFKEVKIITTLIENPQGYGRIIEKNKVFEKIVEEKDTSEEEKMVKKVNCGIYAIRSDLLCKYLPLLTNNNSQKEYYLTDIIELIQKGEKVTVGLYNIPKVRQNEIIGVNTTEQLTNLEQLMLWV